MNPLMNPVGSNAEGKLNCINAVVITQQSPDFIRNQDFFCTFIFDICLLVFLDPNADPNGSG